MADSTGKGLRWLYGAAAVIVLFTGFGNMPLWGRYYIADIPGLGWSGNFYINLQVHLFAGAVLLGLALYFLIVYVYSKRDEFRISLSGKIRVALLLLALLSGLIMAARNLSEVRFTYEFQVGMTFFHMGAALTFMIASIACLIARCKWATDFTATSQSDDVEHAQI